MHEFLKWVFDKEKWPEITIDLFDFWHILYYVIIIGLTICMAFYSYKKDRKFKSKMLDVYAFALTGTYIADFFIMPLYMGEIDIDKLPFHICTLLCPLIMLSRYVPSLKKFKTPIAVFAIVGPLMYLTYPGSALGDISPFVYKVVQTFVYHGLVFAYGVLSITTGEVKLEFKKIYHELIGLILIIMWSGLGILTYVDYDWFFLKGSTFPFIQPSWLMPLVVLACVFAMCAIIHLIFFYIYKGLKKKDLLHYLDN